LAKSAMLELSRESPPINEKLLTLRGIETILAMLLLLTSPFSNDV
jgi:hypothetical protein